MAHSANCPYCSQAMEPVKMHCSSCHVSIEGEFRRSLLSLLSDEESVFLVEYILAGCSIKGMEKRIGMSYPAIRARLDRLIARVRLCAEPERRKQEILDQLERGEITAQEAVRVLQNS